MVPGLARPSRPFASRICDASVSAFSAVRRGYPRGGWNLLPARQQRRARFGAAWRWKHRSSRSPSSARRQRRRGASPPDPLSSRRRRGDSQTKRQELEKRREMGSERSLRVGVATNVCSREHPGARCHRQGHELRAHAGLGGRRDGGGWIHLATQARIGRCGPMWAVLPAAGRHVAHDTAGGTRCVRGRRSHREQQSEQTRHPPIHAHDLFLHSVAQGAIRLGSLMS
jgi:hypothetical protein